MCLALCNCLHCLWHLCILVFKCVYASLYTLTPTGSYTTLMLSLWFLSFTTTLCIVYMLSVICLTKQILMGNSTLPLSNLKWHPQSFHIHTDNYISCQVAREDKHGWCIFVCFTDLQLAMTCYEQVRINIGELIHTNNKRKNKSLLTASTELQNFIWCLKLILLVQLLSRLITIIVHFEFT